MLFLSVVYNGGSLMVPAISAYLFATVDGPQLLATAHLLLHSSALDAIFFAAEPRKASTSRHAGTGCGVVACPL